jgi:hypothetical protein
MEVATHMGLSGQQKIAAIAWAARIRGMTYGQLAAKLTKAEEYKLFKRYERHLELQKKKR